VHVDLDAPRHAVHRRRERARKTPSLQFLVHDREASARPYQHLDLGTATIEKEKEVAAKRIESEYRSHLVGESLERSSKILRVHSDIDTHGVR